MKKMKRSDFASEMTSGWSQMYEIILATSLVWGETPEVEACKLSFQGRSEVTSENQHRKPSLRHSDNELTHDRQLANDEAN